MITLAVDASTYAASVCVARGPDVVVARDVAMRDAQRERLMPAIVEALAAARVDVRGVDRLVCGAGPGSFTSLRIAAAIAKGLALTIGRPLYAVSSLALMVGALEPMPAPGEYVAVLDALRGEAYAATCIVGQRGDIVDVGVARLVRDEEIDALARPGRIVVGEGREVRGAPNARGVVRVAALLERDGAVDLGRWEPDYGRMAEAQRRWEAAHGRAMPHA